MIESRYADPADGKCDACQGTPEVLVHLGKDLARKDLRLCRACRVELIKFLTPPGGETPKRKR